MSDVVLPEELVEAVAEALYRDGGNDASMWRYLGPASADHWRTMARAAIAAVFDYQTPCTTCGDTRWLCDEHEAVACVECHENDGSLSGCPDCPGSWVLRRDELEQVGWYEGPAQTRHGYVLNIEKVGTTNSVPVFRPPPNPGDKT